MAFKIPRPDNFPDLPVPSDRTNTILKWVLGVAVVIFLIFLLVVVVQLSGRSDTFAERLQAAKQDRAALQAENDEQDQAIAERNSAIGQANKKLKDAGEEPVKVPDQPVSVPEADGSPVLTSADVSALIEAEVSAQNPGLSDAQKASMVEQAAEKAMARIDLPQDGEKGADGQDGTSVTVEEVRPIIVSEVAQIPVPKDGKDGADGEDGAPGTVGAVGPMGPEGPVGPAGPEGPAGAPGADGQDGSAVPGEYACGEGEYAYGLTIAADGSVTLSCRTLPTTPPVESTTEDPAPTSTTPSGG